MEHAQDGTPVREITLNHVVAWTLAWYRRRAGLTQVQLRDRLGWTGTSVSEAERSWDGKRVREFDAQTLAAIARALGVPLLALFLPPADDGRGCIYELQPPGTEEKPLPMAEVMASLVMPDWPSENPLMDTYRHRLRDAVHLYTDPEKEADVERWLSPADEEAARKERAALYRSIAGQASDFLGDIIDDYTARADALDPEGATEEEA